MRALPYNFELALQAKRRHPDYKILAFDPKLDSMSAVVCGTYTQTPLDLTQYCSDINWTPNRLSFTLKDKNAIFHPDFGAQRNFLVNGAIIRLREGDRYLGVADWINTFTGMIQGQVGWRKTRRSTAQEAKISVYSRDNNQSWKRRSLTTRTYSAGTEIGVMLYDICTEFMGLTEDEIRISQVLGLQLKHKVNQIVQVVPWEALTSILEAVGCVPCFDGDGRLNCYLKNTTGPHAQALKEWTKILDYEVPEYTHEPINKVRVVFIDSALEQVDGSYQKLGDAQVTTGFFSMHESLPCNWSTDGRQRAHSTEMKVIKSVNSGILPVGTESYQEVDEFHGVVDVEISVWVPILASAMLLEYIAAAKIFDVTNPGQTAAILPGQAVLAPPPAGVGATTVPWTANVATPGTTTPWGRILQAQALAAILLIMMSIGSAQYEIYGIPYDMAYVEKESIAIECNLEYWQINEKVIKNDFMSSYEQADAIALMNLIWEKSSAYPRKLVIQDDPSWEVGDMIRLPDGIKFFITDMSKTLARGSVPTLSLTGFKCKRS
jgi:hypothetical protein